jgi:hypothetical protein
MATAQVVTINEYRAHPFIKKIKWDWLCTDLGVVSSQTTGTYTGELIRLITDPDAAGDAPTDNYNITILDEDGFDVLIGGGLLRDTANTEQVLASSLGCCYNTKLTLTIADAGDANKGIVILYIKTHRL